MTAALLGPDDDLRHRPVAGGRMRDSLFWELIMPEEELGMQVYLYITGAGKVGYNVCIWGPQAQPLAVHLHQGRVPDDAVLLSLGDSMARWEQVLSRASGPTLRVQSPEGSSWWVGTRDDPNAILVDAPVYELFRGVGGRRSLDQVVGWNWAADPEPILSLGLPYPFRWAAHALFD